MSKNSTTEVRKIGSAFDLLGKSVEIVKSNWQAFAVVNILAILSALGNPFGKTDKLENGWTSGASDQVGALSGGDIAAILGVGFGVILLLAIVGIFLFTMATSLEVKSTAGKKPDLSELFNDGKKYFFRIIGVVIVSGLIVMLGFVLLIVPGIIALGRLVMSPYHLVDKDLRVMEAIKQSNRQAIGRLGLVWGAIGVTILIMFSAAIVGVIPIVGPLLGAVITIAYSLVLALRYQQLKAA